MSNDPYNYFAKPISTAQKKYEALRDFLKDAANEDMFFIDRKLGRREKDTEGNITALIINLRKKYLSVPDIKAIADSRGHKISVSFFSLIDPPVFHTY